MDNFENLVGKPLPLNLPELCESVKICNEFDEISCNLNVLEWKFLLAIMAVMVPDANRKGGFIIRASEIADLFGLRRNRKRIIWNMLDAFWEKTICWGERGRLRWFYRLERFENNDDFIYFRMDEDLAAFLTSYEKGYVLAKFEKIFKFSCKYSFQLYFVAAKAKKYRMRKFEIGNMIDFLELPASYSIRKLKDKVLNPAIEEINKITNLSVTYEITKNFKTITFKISETDEFFESLSPDAQTAYTYFKEQLMVAKSAIKKCVNNFGEETLIRIYMDFLHKDLKEIKNLAAYAATCLRNGYFNHESMQKQKNIEINQPQEEIVDASIVDEELNAVKEARESLLTEIKSLPEEEQKILFQNVLEFTKNESKIYYAVLSRNDYKTILEKEGITGAYLSQLQKMREGESGGATS